MVVNPDGTVQFEGDVGKLMRGGAQGGTDLATANRAARVTKYGADTVGKMEAAGSTFGGARAAAPSAPSVATATNPAPIATSTAASQLNFGQKALRALRFGGKALGAAGIGITAGTAAMKTADTPTEEYEKRFGIGPSNLDSPALRLGRDVAVRSAGALVDLGDAVNPFSSTGAKAAAPAIAPNTNAGAPAAAPLTSLQPGVTNYPSVASSPAEARALISGAQSVPAQGTGTAVNNRTGKTMTFNTGVPAAAAPTGAQPEAPVAPLPTLGTEGGIFTNLAKFQTDVAKRAAVTAQGAQGFNRTIKLGTLGYHQQEAEARGLAAQGTYMRGAAAVANAGEAGKKVTTDLMGNPVITDTKKGTALAPTVMKTIPESDITATMAANKMTREQVVARLRAEGRMQ